MQKSPPRLIAVLSDDEALARALGEHLTEATGWTVRAVRPDAPPPPGALLIADTTEGLSLSLGDQSTGRPIPLPVRLSNLIARIEAEFAPAQRTVGDFLFEPGERVLTHEESGAAVRLTELENAILQRLVEADGDVVEREKLLAEVWGYAADANTHTVETHVWRLRQKLSDEAGTLLVTDGGGYRLEL